jgi:hypothetical protein
MDLEVTLVHAVHQAEVVTSRVTGVPKTVFQEAATVGGGGRL